MHSFQRRRNDYIKHQVLAVLLAMSALQPYTVRAWQLPGVSISDADALHKAASEEVIVQFLSHSIRLQRLAAVVVQRYGPPASPARGVLLRSRCAPAVFHVVAISVS
jgi:hypothetical protein